MAFNNYYPATYYPQQYVQTPLVQPQAINPITWVQGEAGAKSYLVGAGQSVMLMDSENPFFYIKSADQAGMPVLRKFKFEEITDMNQQMVQPENKEEYITREEFEKRMSELSFNRKNNNNNRRDNRDGKSNS